MTAAAAATSLHYFRAGFSVEQKADERPVTVADRETEAALRKAIAARYPDHGILGEEYGSDGLERDFLWVVDQIAGTTSSSRARPYAACCGRSDDRRVGHAWVIACRFRGAADT